MWNELLRKIARQSARQGSLPEPTSQFLCRIWPALVGEEIARLSSPVRLREGTLYLSARSRALVDDWKTSPVPLLRRLRRFSPWTIDSLQIDYDADAGVLDREDTDDAPPAMPASQGAVAADLPVADDVENGLDPELRSILASIERHRRNDGDDLG